jgi:hypothetical protein
VPIPSTDHLKSFNIAGMHHKAKRATYWERKTWVEEHMLEVMDWAKGKKRGAQWAMKSL